VPYLAARGRPAIGARRLGREGHRIVMTTKIAIVTGSNTGIGKATALGLAKTGAQVVLAVRDVAKGEAAAKDIVAGAKNDAVAVMPLDLGDFASIRAFGRSFAQRFGQLHVLVNNAGVWTRERRETKDGLESTFGVNHVGTALLTQELLPALEKGAPARVVVVSSGLHYRGKMQWDDLQQSRGKFAGDRAYNQSKLANVLFANALARRTKGRGITVNSLHPGVVATELAREFPRVVRAIIPLFMLTPEQGAACSVYVATSPVIEGTTGAYFDKSKPKTPSADARDEAQQERLWSITEGLTGSVASSAA
jgi:NAD(P)-dependent dehydrogenase (short-subunit alcohol dehydrogenase family)